MYTIHNTRRHHCNPFRLSLLMRILLFAFVIALYGAPSAIAQSDAPQTAIDMEKTPDDAVQAVIRIEARGGDYVDFGEETPRTFRGHASGFIVDPSGTAITNHHAVSGATILNVYVGDSDTPLPARVLGVNECADLAVIQIQGDDFPHLDWHPDPVVRRLPVETIGFPLDAAEATFTPGIISSTQANGQTPWASLSNVLLHSAVINPGSSGGPLVDAQGRVVGINYAGNSARNQYFAISHELAQPIIEQLRQGLSIDAIGINGEAFELENSATGIWVYSIKPGSPADRTGIQAGDILSSLGGIHLGSNITMQEYCEVLRTHSATDTINVDVYRLSEKADCSGQINGRVLQCVSDSTPTSTSISTPTPASTAAPFQYRKLTVGNGLIVFERPVDWRDTDVTLWEFVEETVGLRVETAPDIDDFHNTWDSSGRNRSVPPLISIHPKLQGLLNRRGEVNGYFGTFFKYFECAGRSHEYNRIAGPICLS